MAAGLAGLTEVYTPDAARALNARGDRLRDRINALFLAHAAPLQATGIGSMLALHTTSAPIRSAEDAAKADGRLKELLFFDLLEHGIWIARRGMLALSLPIGDGECDRLISALTEFVESRASLVR
jgi:glutamate-1-semialdehyde 2,1-aminomutase